MKLSVIIPVYNAAEFIRKSYYSILQQQLEDFEIIYVDNKSTDDSVKKIKKLQSKDPRIRLLHQTKQGAGPTRNKGITKAKGQYIYFFDVDDEIYPDAVNKLIDILEKHESLEAVFGKMMKTRQRMVDIREPIDDTFDLQIRKAPYWGLKWFSDLKSVVGPPAFLYRAEVFKIIGYYNEDLKIGEDTALDIRLGMLCSIGFIDMHVYSYFKHQHSTIKKTKVKLPRAFMIWPRLVKEHLPFYLTRDLPSRFEYLLFGKIYQSMGRQIEYTEGFFNRLQLKSRLLNDISALKTPLKIRLYLSLLVIVPLEILRKYYSYKLVPHEVKKIQVNSGN